VLYIKYISKVLIADRFTAHSLDSNNI